MRRIHRGTEWGRSVNYKLIFFDFDGTLADSYPWFLSVFGDLARRYKLPDLARDELDQLRAFDIHHILAKYKISIWKMVLIGNHLKKLMSAQIDRIPLVEGMQQVITGLFEQGVRLAIVTSNSAKNVRCVLGARNIARFDYVETSVSMFGKKSRFQKILRKAGLAAHEALSIGDEVRDLQSSRALQIPFGAVTWGYTDRKMLQQHQPEAMFERPEEILTRGLL